MAASGDVRRSVMPTTRAPEFRARLAILTVSAAHGKALRKQHPWMCAVERGRAPRHLTGKNQRAPTNIVRHVILWPRGFIPDQPPFGRARVGKDFQSIRDLYLIRHGESAKDVNFIARYLICRAERQKSLNAG